MERFDSESAAFDQHDFEVGAQKSPETINPLLQERLEALIPNADRLAAGGIVAERAGRVCTRLSADNEQLRSFDVERILCHGENNFLQDDPHDNREPPDGLNLGPGPFGSSPGHSMHIDVGDTSYRYTVDKYGFHRLAEIHEDYAARGLPEGASEEVFRQACEAYYERIAMRIKAQELLAQQGLLQPSRMEAETLTDAIKLWEVYPWNPDDVSGTFAGFIAESATSPAATDADAQAFQQAIDAALAAEEVYIAKQRKCSLQDKRDVFIYVSHLRQPDGILSFREYSIAIREPLASGGYKRTRLEYVPDQHIAGVRFSTEVPNKHGYVSRVTDVEIRATLDIVKRFKDSIDALHSSQTNNNS